MSPERAPCLELPKRPGELSNSSASNPVPIETPSAQSKPPENTRFTMHEPQTRDSKELCAESKNPFDHPNESLLIAEGYVNHCNAKILFDSGAVLNHISLEFCEKNGIPVREEDEHIGVMANKAEQTLKSTVSDVTISIGPYTEAMRFVANPQNHDIILGKKWCSNHEATLKCATNEIDFWHRGKLFKITARPHVPLKEVSVNSITKDYKLGCPMYAAILREVRDDITPKDQKHIKSLIEKYKDVFPDELPKGLPPQRPQGDFRIELKEGSNPIKKGLYRMSPTELEETKAQVE